MKKLVKEREITGKKTLARHEKTKQEETKQNRIKADKTRDKNLNNRKCNKNDLEEKLKAKKEKQ